MMKSVDGRLQSSVFGVMRGGTNLSILRDIVLFKGLCSQQEHWKRCWITRTETLPSNN